jgi:hypothetical protein
MPDLAAGAVVAIAIPRVRCSTFPCHPNHSKVQSKLNQTHIKEILPPKTFFQMLKHFFIDILI